MKKLLLLLLCVPLIGVGQPFKEIKQYSTDKSDSKYKSIQSCLFRTTFEVYEPIVEREFHLHDPRNVPSIIIPFEEINNLKDFLVKGREKFYEWDSIRIANDIKSMDKKMEIKGLDPFRVRGDDYGGFYGISSLEIKYKSSETGKSEMQLYLFVCDEHCVRSDIFSSTVFTNYDQNINAVFQEFLDDLTVEFYQTKRKEINNKSSLFK